MSTSENALTAHILIDNPENLAAIKSDLKEELEEHKVKHSTLEFELMAENCSESNL